MERTDQPTPQEPDHTPQPSPIIGRPATVEDCRADYEAAADIRARLGWTNGSN
jgi:hypothetical protein